jgi:thioredoxin 1
VELTKENFEEVITGNDTVVVDYWADWCAPCKSFGPVFEKVSEDFPDAVFAKVDTQSEQEIAAWFQIRSIPTLMIFREKVIVFSQAGALAEGALRQVVNKAENLDMEEVHKQVAQQQAKKANQAPPA